MSRSESNAAVILGSWLIFWVCFQADDLSTTALQSPTDSQSQNMNRKQYNTCLAIGMVTTTGQDVNSTWSSLALFLSLHFVQHVLSCNRSHLLPPSPPVFAFQTSLWSCQYFSTRRPPLDPKTTNVSHMKASAGTGLACDPDQDCDSNTMTS